MKKFVLAAAVTLIAGCGGAVLPQVHDEAGRLELARRLYAKGDATMAIEVLAPYSTSGSGSADVDQAVYLLGLCHLQIKDFPAAQADFERLARDYPESDSAAAAAYRAGEAMWGQSRGPDFDQDFTLQALNQWMAFRRDYPDHWLAESATRRIAEARTRLATKLYRTGDLYVKLREFEAARRYFRDVMQEYSESPVYGDALIGWAVASARLGERDTAYAVLRDLEREFTGRPLAEKAAQAREMISRSKQRPGDGSRRSPPNEPARPGISGGLEP